MLVEWAGQKRIGRTKKEWTGEKEGRCGFRSAHFHSKLQMLLPFFGVLLGLFLHGESPSAVVLEGASVAASNPLRFVYE